ncbi:hypothetical protein E2C01_052442 [Portunus trituberculatus]|uniref:Uncharacterized protein n=1 Tax=Portunus trituberculatus TaxID=210409 RepID=A0A5B7GMG9_PORTR|nr:hypothetical protein [Portunus trituberculatus]
MSSSGWTLAHWSFKSKYSSDIEVKQVGIEKIVKTNHLFILKCLIWWCFQFV